MTSTTKTIVISAIAMLFIGGGVGAWFAFSITSRPSNSSDRIEQLPAVIVDELSSFPIYPGATIVRSDRKSSDDKQGFEIYIVSEDPVVDVATFYLQHMPDYGWQITPRDTSVNPSWSRHLDYLVSYGRYQGLFQIIASEEEVGMTDIIVEIPLQ